MSLPSKFIIARQIRKFEESLSFRSSCTRDVHSWPRALSAIYSTILGKDTIIGKERANFFETDYSPVIEFYLFYFLLRIFEQQQNRVDVRVCKILMII